MKIPYYKLLSFVLLIIGYDEEIALEQALAEVEQTEDCAVIEDIDGKK